ncbi:MAG TPA: 7-cyano-7-deazaguanine synthase QueC [Candidatus Polarisedimenticolaceae bacterium]|nr:7-cyano-7-deazaguanine synthase QueC [Candidatus Polarisedimenticolaceae bacterium]
MSDDVGRPAVVLLSGGLDSATTLALVLARGFDASALTVRYGQRHAVEIACARAVARALGATRHHVADLDLRFVGGSALTDLAIAVPKGRDPAEIDRSIPVTYVPARNLLFLSLALAWAEVLGASDLFIGVNAVDYGGYPDCRPEFVSAFERVANLATWRGTDGCVIRVHAPLIGMTKAQIVAEAVRLGVDLGLTVSCYDPSPDGRSCGACDSCVLRARGFEQAGIADPALDR